MKIEFTNHSCIVTREKGDRKYYGVGNAAGESNLFHAIKTQLKRFGWDVIKKRMAKDGHMVDDMQQYIRTRKMTGEWAFCIYNTHWQIEGAEVDWNKNGKVRLALHWLDPDSCQNRGEKIALDPTKGRK